MSMAEQQTRSGGVRLTVIAPCFNEEANVDLLAERTTATFDAMGVPCELVLVDDGSSDCTWERISEQQRRDPRVRGILHERNQGMEAAWRTGLNAANGELVCLIDADLQNRPEDVKTLHDRWSQGGHDITQAVRHAVAAATDRKVFTRGLNLLLNVLFGTHCRDNKSGFILCKREVLGAILAHRFAYRYFQSFIGVSAICRGYTIGEVDTVLDARHGGRSFLTRPVLTSLRICWELVKFRYELTAERWFSRPVDCQCGPMLCATPGASAL